MSYLNVNLNIKYFNNNNYFHDFVSRGACFVYRVFILAHFEIQLEHLLVVNF